MHVLEVEGHPGFIFPFPHCEETKARGCVFCDDTKTRIPPQTSALLHPALPRAGIAAGVCFCGTFPWRAGDRTRVQMPFI